MDAQKRKKNYFASNSNYQKRRRQYNLEPGMTGFFCTCNFHEKDCIRDAYKLLNEFADNLYGSDNVKAESKEIKGDETATEKKDSENWRKKSDDEEEDISAALSKEVADLKAVTDRPAASRRFQVVETGVKNVVFIKTNLPDPLELVLAILKDLEETKKQRTRFLLRLLPIHVVCKANMDNIKAKAEILLEKYFAQEPKKFCIVFNRHSNQKIQRNDVIENLAEIIAKKNPGNKADLKNPELSVIVEVIRGLCLLAVAPDYFKYKKYNLLEICGVKEQDKKATEKAEGAEVKDESPEETIESENNAESASTQKDKDSKETVQIEAAVQNVDDKAEAAN